MEDIVSRVQRVAEAVGRISAAGTEQSAGMEQIGAAVGNLDQMTQQNAALVEESTAAAQVLKAQAHQLAAVVGAFRLKESQGRAALQAQAVLARAARRDAPASASARAAAPAGDARGVREKNWESF